MNDFWHRLLGLRTGEAVDIVGGNLQLHPAIGWVTWIALVAAAAAVAVASYRLRGFGLAPARVRLLLALRLAALLGLAAVLLRPSLGLRVEGAIRQTLVLLFDQSASFALVDPRTDPADQARAAIATGALGPAAGLTAPLPPPAAALHPTRLDLLRSVLTNRELALLERLGRTFDLRAHGFAGTLLPLPLTDTNTAPTPGAAPNPSPLAAALRAEGRETAPGTALREVLDQERGRPLAGIVMFTDGIRNAGPDPTEIARLARDAGVPVHTVGLGTTAPRDLQVVDLTAPDAAFARDEVAVSARLRARGLAGQTARVALRLDGTVVDEREVRFAEDGDVVADLKATPDRPGDVELAVEVAARPDEILAENNRASRRLRVLDDRIRVLFIEQSPRWEYRYLQALLLRDRRVDLKCLLFDGDPAIARTPDSPYLESFPARREDLFGFDLVVFGDVDPRNFTPSQLDLIAEFVSRAGGSLLMIAGRRFAPWSYRDSPLDRLLPVEFDRPSLGNPTTTLHDRPLRLALTPEGKTSPLLRLADDPEEHLRRWEALAPVFWIAPVARAKPAAQVLVVQQTGDDRQPRIPVIALQQYGVGQTMFVGTDNTWRWRRNEGEQFYVSFWGRVVQRLAINHLVSGNRRTQIALDRTVALPGERLGLTARLFDSAFEPLTDPTVRGRIERENPTPPGATPAPAPATPPAATAPLEVVLRAVPDQPGVYRGDLTAPAPGRYRLVLGEEVPAALDFTVDNRIVEAGETALQSASLQELSAATGGASFREEDLHRLPDTVRGKAQRVQSRLSVDLWSSPLYYLGILLLLAVEWILRKLWQLK
jgi:uncharacterized membrane protein